jgi:threonine aldolase
MAYIDFRSDTVASPTKEMLDSVITAEYGDDSRSLRDPTVVKLEKYAANKLGKEAALLVPSGTMGNLVSVLANSVRNNEVILDIESHLFTNEHAYPLIVGGLFPVPIQSKCGYMDLENIKNAIKSKKGPIRTGLICLENTHNSAGGIALTTEYMKELWKIAREHNIPIHLDGARIFNAAIYLNVDVKKIAKYTDSVTFCLSKGLCAPLGAIVCGPKDLIEKARYHRKLHGGRMKKAGLIAAPGMVALTNMVDRMKQDHDMARILGEGIKENKGIKLLHQIQTNIIRINVSGLGVNAEKFVSELKKNKILTEAKGDNTVRLVTHKDIQIEDVEYAVEIIKKIKPFR